jgi:hypothetical protein
VIAVLALVGAILFITLALIAYAVYLAEGGLGPRRAQSPDQPVTRLEDRLSPVAGTVLVRRAFSRPKPNS